METFNSNYIFYCENIGEIHNKNFRNGLEYFLTDVNNGEYDKYRTIEKEERNKYMSDHLPIFAKILSEDLGLQHQKML